MEALRRTSYRFGLQGLGLGIVLALAACGSDKKSTDEGPSTADKGDDGDDETDDTDEGGEKDAGKPMDAGKADAGKPDAGKPDAGKPDAGKPDAGAPDAQLPSGDGGPRGDAGTDGGFTGGGALNDCVAADRDAGTKPCGTFKTALGVDIKLGPYGAVAEQNVGKGFENTVDPTDATPGGCVPFAALFAEPQAETDELLNTTGLDFALYTVFRPANWVPGEKVPIVTWGNGTCAQPEGYGALLRYVASHGFFVIAPNSRWVGSSNEMRKALDFAFKANEDPASPYYQKLDTTKVAAMGHSQGGSGASMTSSDARVKTAILFNGGTTASGKPFLAVSGDMDLNGSTAAAFATSIGRAPPSASLYYHMVPMTGNASGHLTLMRQPERVIEPTTAWLKYQLKGDEEGKSYFVGATCGLCSKPADYEFKANGLN